MCSFGFDIVLSILRCANKENKFNLMFGRDNSNKKMSDSGGGSSTGVVPKTQKAKRKISLPWFRQGSVQQNHPGLTRQHTIDTPSSFHARLLRRQPSQNALVNFSLYLN